MDIIRVANDDPRIRDMATRLEKYNAGHGLLDGAPDYFAFVALDTDGIALGAAEGKLWDGWLNLDLLLVIEKNRGTGSMLLRQVESFARKRNCRGVYLDTLGFQAPGFYLKSGYRKVGEIPDYIGGHGRITFEKRFDK
jgi:GNAT superfamily N-acetyltransferase